MFFKGHIPWNKGLKGAQVGWMKGHVYVLPESKPCADCKQVLAANKFRVKRSGRQKGQLSCYCIECSRRQSREWRLENPERYLENIKDWESRNPGYQNEYRKNKRANDPQWKIAGSIRSRFGVFLRGGAPKNCTTLELYGAPLENVKRHLESQFRPGMTWHNHGKIWEIDHIKPCSKFDLTDFEQQKSCFNFSNLQPLFVSENRKKGNR